ncbi:MAG: flagellin [Planctomycetota bacterium]
MRIYSSKLSVGLNPMDTLAMRQIRDAQAQKAQSLTRLATGQRINRAADDPSGMMFVTKADAELASIDSRIKAMERNNLRLAAQEGALSVVSDLALELEGLVVQAANDGGLGDGEKESIQVQIDGILKALTSLSATQQYNGEQILSNYGPTNLGVVTKTDEDGNKVRYSLADMVTGGALDAEGDQELAQDVVESAVAQLSGQRAAIGTRINQNESLIRVEMVAFEEQMRARSLEQDTDFAQETSNLARAQILEQTSIVAAQVARQQAESVLALLEPLAP